MQLATIKSPTNASLYEGSTILNNIGISPLTLAALGLLSRLLDNINKSHRTLINSHMLRAIELIVIVGLVLGIVGGIDAANNIVKDGRYKPGPLNKAGTALMIVAYVLLVMATAITSFSISHAEHGERRLLTAIALAMPFLAVRLVYSIISTFTTIKSFNLFSGNPTVFLCVCLLEELVMVLLFEGTGLTLKQIPHGDHVDSARIPSSEGNAYRRQATAPKNSFGSKVMKVLSYTIIGRVIMMLIPRGESDVEMQSREQQLQK